MNYGFLSSLHFCTTLYCNLCQILSPRLLVYLNVYSFVCEQGNSERTDLDQIFKRGEKWRKE